MPRKPCHTPDITALLVRLQNTDIKLYIATNKRISPTMKIIDYLGWQDFLSRYAPLIS
ncbi:MAG: hypothetical protein Q9N32_06770 [Gammaproteobacteria bacterium]|nr:hypothetical protein [Gammaproteobacteria bacterium]